MNRIIRIAESDADIVARRAVMCEPRPHVTADQFLARVRRQAAAGYCLAYVQVAADVVAATGYRVMENLAWGRFLYVDDLVTHPAHRSQGHGAALLAWLRQHAADSGCQQFHLDSGVQRLDAHRFYEREGLTTTSFHFSEPI